MRVRFQQDVRAGDKFGDPIGAVIEARVSRIGVVTGAQPIFRWRRKGFPLDMGRQQHEILDRRIVEGQFVDVQREGLLILDVDCTDAAIQLGVADPALRVAADFVGEPHIGGRHRHAVCPLRIGTDRVGQIDALLAIRQIDGDCEPIGDRRQFRAQQTGELPFRVVDSERPQGHSEHVALGCHHIDVRVQRRRELGNADRQCLVLRRSRRHRAPPGQQPNQQRDTPVAPRRPVLAENVHKPHSNHPSA